MTTKAIGKVTLSAGKALALLKIHLTHFHAQAGEVKMHAMRTLQQANGVKAIQLTEYRRCLLFIAAYPQTPEEYKAAKLGLSSLLQKIEKLPAHQKKDLAQSGLPGTLLHGVYSFHLVNWLLQYNALKAGLAYLEEGALHPAQVLKDRFPEMEFELESKGYLKASKWLELALGTAHRQELLKRLLHLFSSHQLNGSQKDHLFEALRPCISLHCGAAEPELPFKASVYFHAQGLLKRVDEVALVAEPLPPAKPLTTKQKTDTIACARLSLLFLNRETDPITLCDKHGLEYYELHRGFSIALFSANAERRLPIESYIGFMMFKNGAPVAYGGAWLFGKRSLLGINIYESYRGGESAFLFSQLLRTYKQRFLPATIEVEPYQFGKDNPEGIQTGAFWFYYRFGFRPVDQRLKQLAEKEFCRIQKNKTYKSPASVLKAFTHSNMMLGFNPGSVNLDPSVISHFITLTIAEKFNGHRGEFKTWAYRYLEKHLSLTLKKLNRVEKIGLEKLYPFLSLCLDFSNMSTIQKDELKHLVLEKGKSEFKYAVACERFPFEDFIQPNALREQLGLQLQ